MPELLLLGIFCRILAKNSINQENEFTFSIFRVLFPVLCLVVVF